MRLLTALLVWTALVTAALAQQSSPSASAAEPPAGAAAPTFNQDVAPILFKSCTECHRPGQMAPMSLLDYESARPWARSIKQQVSNRTMPPWGADPHIGRFANDPSLTDDEIARIVRWVDSGAQRGVEPPPAPPAYADGWQIGTPDLIVSMDKAFPIPATGLIEYQYFQIPTNLAEDRWVQGIEVRPGDSRAVHHLRVFAQGAEPDGRKLPKPGERLCVDEVCGNLEPPLLGWGPNLASIAVGTRPETYPLGAAKRLKAGSVLTLHVHYTTYGEASQDRTQVGFIFAKTPPSVELKTVSLAQEQFAIPPGAGAHAVEGTVEFLEDVRVYSLGPHAHLRGKSWQFWLTTPDGQKREVLSVPKFDFDWQLHYLFADPLVVPAGSRLTGRAVYDNSKENRFNPDANATVRWGNLTVDEMMFASVVYSRSSAKPSAAGR